MDRKILVMVMVPVLVVMSGALAFSAFTGTATTNVSASAGYLSWEQTVTSTYTYEHNTAVTNNSMSAQSVSTPMSGPNVTTMSLTASNLAPGNWIVFNITVMNTGSVGLELSSASIKTTETSGLVNASTVASSFAYGQELSGTGYMYCVTEVPSGSIDNGGTTAYQIFLGLGSGSSNMYQESSFTLSVGVTVTSDP